MDKDELPESDNSIQQIQRVQNIPEKLDSSSKSSNSSDGDTGSLIGGFGPQGFQTGSKLNEAEEEEPFDKGSGGEDENLSNEEMEPSPEDTELEQESKDSETDPGFLENFEEEDEEEPDPDAILLQNIASSNKELPEAQSPFAMSNQEIRDFIDPDNEKDFNAKMEKISEMLESAHKEFSSNDLESSQPKGTEFQLDEEMLTELVENNHSLDLPGNFLQSCVGRRLNDDDLPDLIEFLISDNTVHKLNLAYNEFTDDGILTLAELLTKKINIHSLNVAYNNMTPAGVQRFAKVLMDRPSLHFLKLSGMKIGDEGFNGLICLYMCGRGPYNLDVSETDMSIQSFQGLCTAWQAMDKDEDYPKYLLTHTLPFTLEHLSSMKKTINDRIVSENSVLHQRSTVTFVDNRGDGDKKNLSGSMIQQAVSAVPHETNHGEGEDPVRIVEKLSATILEGLFEIPELKAQSYAKTKSLVEGDPGMVEEIVGKANKMPDTDLIIEEYRIIKEAGCATLEPNGKPVIVCPSLYSLDVDDILQSETDRKEGEKTSHFIPTPLDDLINEAAENADKEGRSGKVPDDQTVGKLSTDVAAGVFEEAARLASKSEYEEKSDTAQMLLSIVMETCQQLMDHENSTGDFKDHQLQAIWDAATESAMKVIQSLVPPARCSMTQNEVKAFVRKFLESTNRTFLHLMNNPFIPPLLMDLSAKACVNSMTDDTASAKSKLVVDSSKSASNLDPSHVQRIVISFLQGAISEAAYIIGGGDPFNFRKKHRDLEEILEKSGGTCDEAEGHTQGALDDFFQAGALLAQDSIRAKQELELADGRAEEPATDFVETTFGKVAELIIETKLESKSEEEEEAPRRFRHAARPTRLVLNRPIFQDYEETMGAKLGAYIQGNTTVKCLHMRKWNLGEDGMMNLMDGLIHNTNIVLLDLGSNGIGGEGCKALAVFIRQNKKLKYLMLNHNRLRNPGIVYLTDALPQSNLEFLNIACNDISDEGLDPLLEALPNTQIKALYAVGNHFSQNTWKLLKDLFDSEWLTPKLCDFCLQEVDGKGMIVKNSQIRETNEWYEVPPLVGKGLHRPPYFEENLHDVCMPTEPN